MEPEHPTTPSPYGAPPKKKSRLKLVLALVALLALVVVGAVVTATVLLVDHANEEAGPDDAAEKIAVAVSQRDYEALCNLFTDERRSEALDAAEVENCDDYGERMFDPHEALDVRVKVLDVEQDGDEATVKYSVKWGVAEKTDEFDLVREDGEWRLGAIPDFEIEDRPSRGELITVLSDVGGLDSATAGCVADELLASDLTDAELGAIVSDDRSRLTDQDVEDITSVLTKAVSDCNAGDVGG